MLKNFFTFLYFSIVAIVCVFVFMSINFIIASGETIENNFSRIAILRILYTIILDLLAIGILYIIYLAMRKLMKLEVENKDIFKLLAVILTTVSIISLTVFFLIIN